MKRQVEIYESDKHAEFVHLATYTLEDEGELTIEVTNPDMRHQLTEELENGIWYRKENRMVNQGEPEAFLDALLEMYETSSYAYAQEIGPGAKKVKA